MVYYVVPVLSHEEPFEDAFKTMVPEFLHSVDTMTRRRHFFITDVPWVQEFIRDTRAKCMPIPQGVLSSNDFEGCVETAQTRVRSNKDRDAFIVLPILFVNRTHEHCLIGSAAFHQQDISRLFCKVSGKTTHTAVARFFEGETLEETETTILSDLLYVQSADLKDGDPIGYMNVPREWTRVPESPSDVQPPLYGNEAPHEFHHPTLGSLESA